MEALSSLSPLMHWRQGKQYQHFSAFYSATCPVSQIAKQIIQLDYYVLYSIGALPNAQALIYFSKSL